MAAKKTPAAKAEEKKEEKKEPEKKEPEKKASAAAPAPAPAKKAAPAAPAPPPKPPQTKLGDFLASKKIDARRLIAQSRTLESLQPEDRAIRLAKRLARGGEGGEEAKKETRKPRSGRPVTRRAMHAALWGKKISGPTKTRILKAINAILEIKKAEKVDLKALF